MTLLHADKLTKAYSADTGLFDFSFDLRAGDKVLLLGPNGAGKTTAFKAMLNLINTDSGRVMINEHEVSSHRQVALKAVGAMIAAPVFYDEMTGYQNLKLLANYYPHISHDDLISLLKQVGLLEAMNKKTGTYSSGMKQRLDLARAIMHKPQVLLLDEPFNGMDIEAKYELKQMLLAYQKETQSGLVLSSHMVGDLDQFATRIIMIYQGKTLCDCPYQDLIDTGQSLEAFYLNTLDTYKRKEALYASA